MKLSYEWLEDFVNLDGISPQELADKLTMNAFEVEEVRKVGPDIEGPVVVGEIMQISPHPNADKIRLTRVKVDPHQEPLEIVCGAQNIEVGQIVPVALPGARVLNRHDGSPLHIKAAPIRGVKSNGMLCSPGELGAKSADVDGILILSDRPEFSKTNGLTLGADVKKLLHLLPDWVLHVAPRSNRGDALSVIGLAREVAALFKRPLKEVEWFLPELPFDRLPGDPFLTRIEDPDDCAIFTIRELSGLKVGPSPFRFARRLEAIGVRTVNNIVDITNYVMHELGQPLHAYDVAKLKSRLLQVRRAKENETLETIDARVRTLSDEVLVIADDSSVVGIAGIMGGKESEITDETVSIALEAASFTPARVRRGSRLLGLSSDSSLRFERGVDVVGVSRASDRASYLMLKYCGDTESGTAFGEMSMAGSEAFTAPNIAVRHAQVQRLLDIELTCDEISELLLPLGFALTSTSDARERVIHVSVPSYRTMDVVREIDVIEEIARIYGYDRLPASMPATTVASEPMADTVRVARQILSACGLSEAWISSLVGSEAKAAKEGLKGEAARLLATLENEHTIVEVLNPLSEEHQVLRQSLLPGLLKTAVYNQDRGSKDVFLFEVGRVYERDLKIMDPADHSVTGVTERLLASGVMIGKRTMSIWESHSGAQTSAGLKETNDFYRAKGVVESLLKGLNVDLERVKFFRPPDAPGCFHPYRLAQIISTLKDEEREPVKDSAYKIGFVGELHPALVDGLGLSQSGHLFEIDLDIVERIRREPLFKPVPQTPAVVRDLTPDINNSIDHAVVESTIKTAAGENLTNIELVSIFQLNDTTKSLSYRLTFQSPTDTLTNEAVEEQLERVREALINRLSATFRM
ncbi:MAG TPA: phenylalanine--tRNA ligase subunit beta [Candidatus Obscuribacterales bacterium]